MGWCGICHGTFGAFKKGYDLFQKIYKRKCRNIKKIQAANCRHDNSSDLSDDDVSSVEDDESNVNDCVMNNPTCNDQESDNDSQSEEGSNAEQNECEEIAVEANDVLYVLEMMLSFHAWYKCGEPFQCCNHENRCDIHKGHISDVKYYQK